MSFDRCHWISVVPTMLGPRWFNGSAQNSILWPSYFFLHRLLHSFFSLHLTWLWQAITMVQKLQILKTITFSECSGRALWHGTTLDRSYLFKILSNLRFSFFSFGVFLAFSAQSSWRCLVKSLKLAVWAFSLNFLYDSTLFVIDIH